MVKVVTDTTTGLSKALADKYDITLIPQQVMFGDETLRDGVDISNEVFLQRLKTSAKFPTTSQPPVGDFVEAYKKLLGAGHEVLCITLSAELSGTYNSAEQAKNQVEDERVTLIDSRNVAGGLAMIALEAARMGQAGKSMDEIVARVRRMIEGVHLEVVLDTLEYLVKGGRVSGAAGFFGGLLQMKPILTIDGGKLVPRERIRTKGKAMARLRELIDEVVNGHGKVQMNVNHTGLYEEANSIAQEFRDRYGLDDCPVLDIPPAVAAHAGPGALAVAYFVDN